MAIPTPAQTIVNTSSDSSLNKIYSGDLQGISGVGSVAAVYVNNTQEYVTNYFNNNKPGGTNSEVQFNDSNSLAGDAGFTYDPDTDSLTIAGNIVVGNVRTDNLLYANGDPYSFSGGSSYGNSNVSAYLPTHTGNVAAGNIKTDHLLYSNGTAWSFSGTYTNSNVAAYLPTYSGNVHGGNLTITGLSNLGAVGNITITGGTTGQVLTTDGSGHLSWSTVSGGSGSTPTLQAVVDAGSTTTTGIHISNVAESSSYNDASASFSTTGAVSVAKQIHAGQHIATETSFYAGHLAFQSSWNRPVFIGRNAGADYIQAGLVNTNALGSADWVAYGDQSDDTQGWADFGFTGTNFSDPAYTITKKNDGYFIVQGMPGEGGNLILATGNLGGSTHRDIIFGTGGFSVDNERMRLNHEDQTLYVGAHGDGGTNVTNIDTNGNVTVGGEIIIKNHNAHGGAGFAGMVSMENDTATNGKKFIRIDNTGSLQIVDHTYANTIFSLTNGGAITLKPSTAPTSPTEGTIYYDNAAHGLRLWDGTQWRAISMT